MRRVGELETAPMSQASWPKNVLDLGREGVEKRSKLVPRRQLLDTVGVITCTSVICVILIHTACSSDFQCQSLIQSRHEEHPVSLSGVGSVNQVGSRISRTRANVRGTMWHTRTTRSQVH